MKNTKPKVRLWSVLTGLTAILTVAAIVGNIIANQYATTLNVALNASTYKIIHGENTGDTEYFKKGFASDEEREAYEAELCATVEAEGAALLKNENNALPLASGAKVSLFGHGSFDLMYDGTGSGSVDTSKAPNLKQALEAQGITINQTLWDLYSSDSMMSKYSRMTPASISDTLEANTQYAVNEAPWSALSSAESSFAEYGDAAIVVLSRSGGEGADRPSGENGTSDSWISGQEGDGNYLALSAEEIELLQNLKALKDNGTFKNIVVLINSSNAIELDFLNPEICGSRSSCRRCYVDRRRGPDRYQRCGPAAVRRCHSLRLSGRYLSVRQHGKPRYVQLLHPGLPQRSRVQPADRGRSRTGKVHCLSTRHLPGLPLLRDPLRGCRHGYRQGWRLQLGNHRCLPLRLRRQLHHLRILQLQRDRV